MAAPQLDHDGLLVPNGAEVAATPRMAEVDAVDFNTLANERYGVLEGCAISVSGATVTSTGGWVVIAGLMYQIQGGTAPLGVGGGQDRFDIVVATTQGDITVVRGTEAVDPIFPEPADDQTLLASVYCPAATSVFTDYCVDKRVFLQRSVHTVYDAGRPYLVRQVDAAGAVEFEIDNSGRISWGDAYIERQAAGVLRTQSITSQGQVTANSVVSNDTISAVGLIDGSNLQQGAVLPPTGGLIQGALFQMDNGAIYTNVGGVWEQLATTETAVPVGTVSFNVRGPSAMSALGWRLIDGTTWSETDPSLANLFALPELDPFKTGTAPNRSMTIPTAVGRVLAGASGAGENLSTVGTNSKVLQLSEIPSHNHPGSVVQEGGGHVPEGTVKRGGAHGHAQQANSGKHSHPVTDPGHRHNGFEGAAGNPTSAVVLWWGGTNKIDALFNDANHTYSVEAARWISSATTGISIGSAGSEHTHIFKDAPAHPHDLEMEPVDPHPHDLSITPQGGDDALDMRQDTLRTYCYIKT